MDVEDHSVRSRSPNDTEVKADVLGTVLFLKIWIAALMRLVSHVFIGVMNCAACQSMWWSVMSECLTMMVNFSKSLCIHVLGVLSALWENCVLFPQCRLGHIHIRYGILLHSYWDHAGIRFVCLKFVLSSTLRIIAPPVPTCTQQCTTIP